MREAFSKYLLSAKYCDDCWEYQYKRESSCPQGLHFLIEEDNRFKEVMTREEYFRLGSHGGCELEP